MGTSSQSFSKLPTPAGGVAVPAHMEKHAMSETIINNESGYELPATEAFAKWVSILKSKGQQTVTLMRGVAPTGYDCEYGDCLCAVGDRYSFGRPEYGSFSIEADKIFRLA